MAAYYGNLEIVKLLVEEFKCDANYHRAKLTDGASAFLTAVIESKEDVAMYLLEKGGADINDIDNDSFCALQIASQFGLQRVVKFCLQNNYAAKNEKSGANTKQLKLCNVNYISKDFSNALYLAAQENQLEIVKMLIECDADIDYVTDEAMGALIVAAKKGHTNVAKYLLSMGAKVHFVDKFGCTALHRAAMFGDAVIVKELLLKGANPNTIRENLTTPLSSAIKDSRLDVVKILLEYNEKLSDPNCNEFDACRAANLKPIPLVAHELNSFMPPISFASNLEIIKLLIEHGANVNECRENVPALFEMIKCRISLEALQYVISKGANIHMRVKNSEGSDSNGILQVAVYAELYSIVEYLIDAYGLKLWKETISRIEFDSVSLKQMLMKQGLFENQVASVFRRDVPQIIYSMKPFGNTTRSNCPIELQKFVPNEAKTFFVQDTSGFIAMLKEAYRIPNNYFIEYANDEKFFLLNDHVVFPSEVKITVRAVPLPFKFSDKSNFKDIIIEIKQ